MDDLQGSPGPEVNLKREGLKMGLINGGIALLLMYVGYAMGADAFIDIKMAERVIPYMFLILVVAGLRVRKKRGGYLTMKEGLQFAFLSYVIAAVLIAIGTYVLYNIADPDLGKITFEKGLERTKDILQSIGAPQKEIEDTIAKARKDGSETDFKHIFLGTGLGLIWDFMKSLLIALIIRKEKPAL